MQESRSMEYRVLSMEGDQLNYCVFRISPYTLYSILYTLYATI